MRWIVTDDVFAETWRNLLEFANLDLAFDAIVRRHGKPKSNGQRANYEKQAKQVRVCLLQAKEYFDASRSSSLYTSPNHAYYGAVSLASVAILLLGDGTMSLDYLRSDSRNKHHGLDLRIDCSAGAATQGTTLLDKTSAVPLRYGHFPNWYKVLPSRGAGYAFVRREHESTASISYLPSGGFDVPPYERLEGVAVSLLDLAKFLPDLDADLSRAQVHVARSRTRHDIKVDKRGSTTHTWIVHGCRTPADLDALLEKFSIVSRYADDLSCKLQPERNAAVVSIKYLAPAEIGFSWASSRDTLSHDTFSYAEIRDTYELVDLFIIAYQLSMLARYYPDIWVGCIESQCRGAKLVERIVSLLIKKLPMLVLSVIAEEETIVSTHREPWKEM